MELFTNAVAIVVFVLAMRSILKGARIGIASKSWPSVNGKVLFTKMGSINSLSQRALAPHLLVDVSYEYVIQGKTYKGTAIGANNMNPTYPILPFMKKPENPYRKGDTVRVFYDPLHPEKCLLESGLPQQVWLWLVVMFLVAVICLFEIISYNF